MTTARASARRLLALGTRLVIAGAAIGLLLAATVPTPLERDGRVFLSIAWTTFMVRTFWFHIGLGLIPFVIAAALLRLKKSWLLGAALLAWTLIPSLWSLRPRSIPPTAGPSLTVMSINLFFGNDDISAVEASIRHEDPDLILLQEYTPDAAARLDPLLRDRYPFVLDFSREGAFGQGIFSRRPFIGTPDPFPHHNPLNGTPLPPGTVAFDQPQLRVVIDVGGRELVIQNTHLPAPISMQFFRDQRVWIHWLAQQVQVSTGPLIVAGDFNATQQSRELAALRDVGLVSALDVSGTGRCATWPHQHWFKYVPGVRIDQFMSKGTNCTWARTGLPTGSDHLPIVACFQSVPPVPKP